MKKLIIALIGIIAFYGCKEPVWNPVPTDGVTPGPVRSYTVTNTFGKAIIHFEVPDENALYIEAEYTLDNGETMGVKASKFADSLIVEGFAQAKDYTVQLYAVGSNEQRSSPTAVTVTPDQPNYLQALASLEAIQAFGGVTVETVNPGQDDLVIEALRKAPDGEWEPIDRFYSGIKDIRYHIRGQKDSLQTFAFFVRDRWLNYSDTVEFDILPLREILIPAVDIFEMPIAQMPGSARPWSGSYLAKKAVDGTIAQTKNQNYYMTARGTGMPQHFNVDLTNTFQLSRAVFYERPEYFYRSISPRRMKIWGATDPNPDGSFDGWTLLGEFEVIKPSGIPGDQINEDDEAQSRAGHDFEFDGATIPVRYLRFQTLETWGQSDYVTMTEISLYGNTVH
ncbi:DUF5000 domain-containing lipoprotein [Parapedobacter sp. 10938]|uniref:DUF5000 domain-containing lipoprotein n=1 Tax=Parapedobacter flavus TaxID=3110225 RepID=UPI002DBC5007|nr:DUF5000 domain-containing lipoprotein [Parapedobacter sp. 10938]MEC3878448.1 DUF5000 domain-containing lipoprotein [Parapedobacter sp. 10938]